MLATPLGPRSVALSETVTSETYQPLFPGVPENAAVVTGGVVSMSTVKVWTVSTSPARSVALNRTVWRPFPRKIGFEYLIHGPLSTLNQIAATPLRLSFAVRFTVTLETYQPF